MRHFSLLIKPAGADCNLRCDYCFYLNRSGLYPHSQRHRMSLEVLERLVASYMATDQPQYIFNWQGGEPTLMGVDFFRQVTRLQKKHGRPGSVVGNGLQTNATLLDDEFAGHLAAYRFLVGVSLDGPADVHDRFRHDAPGRGSHADVLRGIECLRRAGVEFNVLVLVSSANVHRARDVYKHLRGLGIAYHQYIPCVEFDEAGRPLPYTITGPQWGEFLCAIFDQWVHSDVGRVSVRRFDSILNMLVNGRADSCNMSRNCNQYFVVEHNGDVYPCDFFVEESKKLGNIMTDSWESLQNSPRYVRFGRHKTLWNPRCTRCEYLTLCAGDCLKHRIYGGDAGQLSWLCEGWRRFYAYSLPTFEDLARSVKRNSPPPGPV